MVATVVRSAAQASDRHRFVLSEGMGVRLYTRQGGAEVDLQQHVRGLSHSRAADATATFTPDAEVSDKDVDMPFEWIGSGPGPSLPSAPRTATTAATDPLSWIVVESMAGAQFFACVQLIFSAIFVISEAFCCRRPLTV